MILKPEAVLFRPSVGGKNELLRIIGGLASATYGLDRACAIKALVDGESRQSTGVGHGVALPHVRMEKLDCVSGAFVRLKTPVDFRSVDRRPIDLAFAIFSPANAGAEHLKALAVISRTFRDQAVCAQLRSSDNHATLYTIMMQTQSFQAA
ncbi:MAG: PTS sugar transporter subunit IIA [Roseovarius sp.]|nr:PTS sugar transporter subunit IIA [Roseovarius sp.]MCY4207198.1 PTS sugar transporter subunit IIA [Roseovarius sp.]MCY4290443.1 PTS sugar transporter subunit IIA [Roseovarius sp.]